MVETVRITLNWSTVPCARYVLRSKLFLLNDTLRETTPLRTTDPLCIYGPLADAMKRMSTRLMISLPNP